MNLDEPLICIIVTAYNRANLVGRAIKSILIQDYKNFHIVVIDDGSTDNTQDILNSYTDPRISIIVHANNRGVTAAKNTGLNNIKGDWFTFLDSDDEMLPTALSRFVNLISEHPKATAITCNCLDSVTGNFTGKGLNCSQYLDNETLIKSCSGDFWGITRTELLGVDRFNEKLSGWENTLWYKINERSTRYYSHEALLIYYTNNSDSVTAKKPYSLRKSHLFYSEMSKEKQYMNCLSIYNPYIFVNTVFKGIITCAMLLDIPSIFRFISLSMAPNGRQAIIRRYFKN